MYHMYQIQTLKIHQSPINSKGKLQKDIVQD